MEKSRILRAITYLQLLLVAVMIVSSCSKTRTTDASLSEDERRQIEAEMTPEGRRVEHLERFVTVSSPILKMNEKLNGTKIKEDIKRHREMLRKNYLKGTATSSTRYSLDDLEEESEFSKSTSMGQTASNMKMTESQVEDSPLNVKNWPNEYQHWMLGFASTNLNVRKKPSTRAKKIGELLWNEAVKWKQYNKDWAIIEYKDKKAYVASKYIRADKVKSYTEDTVREHQKSWMDYRKITDRSSAQYKLEEKEAYTGDYGIRMVDGRYLCAVGSYYSKDIGRYIDLILEDGTVIPCILGDQKDDGDTDEYNMYTEHDHSVVEFVVDLDEVPAKIKKSGNFCSIDKWSSSIREIRIYYYNPYSKL